MIIARNLEKPFQVIETEGGDQIVLDRREAKKSTRRILNLYRIPSDRSENLKRKFINTGN